MQAVKENKMGIMPEGKLLAGMAVPMMISMLVQALYNIVDSVFVASYSPGEGMTALSWAFPLQSLMIAFGAGTAVGINALLSRSLGEKNYKSANAAANTGIFLSFCSFILFAIIGITLSKPFFAMQSLSGDEITYDIDKIRQYGTEYTTICLGLSIGIFMQFCFERLLQSTGKTTLAMITQLIGAVINIILDPIFIFIFDMGIRGAAIATVIGQVAAAVLAIILNIKCNKEITLSIKGILHPSIYAIKTIYKIGLPSIIMQSIGSVMTFLLNQITGSISAVAPTVFGIYFKLQSFVFMPIFGLNNGMVPIISYNFGAKKEARVKKTIKISIICAVSVMLCGLAVFELAPNLLLKLFSADALTMKVGVPAFRIIALHFLFAGFCIIAGSVCQAIGNPSHSLIVSICRQLVVLIPAAWLLSKTGNITLVWFAFPIAEIFSLTLSIIFLRKTMKKATIAMRHQ